MTKNLLHLFLIIATPLLLQGLTTTDLESRPSDLTELSGREPAHIPIQKGDSGFYVLVNVSSHNTSLASIPTLTNDDDKAVKMLLAPYSSFTLLVGQCLSFSLYDCEKYKCEKSPNSTADYSFPYFIADGYYIKTDAELGDWSLKTEAILSTRCVDSYKPSYGNGTHGILGLGVGGNAWANFKAKDRVMFSLNFFANGTGGELGFSKDLRVKAGTEPVVLRASNNWHVEYVQGVKVGDYKISNLAKMIFDPNEETIGFSLKTYKLVLIGFNKGRVPIKCHNRGQKDFYRPNCTYHGELSDLPNITVLAGNETLAITPQQYIKDYETFNSTAGDLTLNIRAVYDAVHTPENHVTTDYKDYIIIGYCVMKDYYMVFNGRNHHENNNTIELYRPNDGDELGKSFNILWLIIPLVVIIVLFIILGVHFIKKRRERRSKNENRLLDQGEEEYNNEIQDGNVAEVSQDNNKESRALSREEDVQFGFGNISLIPNQPRSGASVSGNVLNF